MAKKAKTYKLHWESSWYVPKGTEILQGRLRTKNKKYVLDLYTSKTFEGISIKENVFERKYLNYPVITGNSKSIFDAGYTLYNCRWIGTKKIGHDLYRVRYNADYVFENAVVKHDDDLILHSAEFSYANLSNWYDGSGSLSKLPFNSSSDLNDAKNKEDLHRKEHRVEVDNEMSFVFIDQYERYEIDMGVSYKRQFNKYLRIEFRHPVHFTELLSAAFSFGRLLEVAMFRRVPFKIVQVELQKSAYQQQEDVPEFLQRRFSGVFSYKTMKHMEVEEEGIHQNYMLFSRWQFSAEILDEIIKQWYSNESFHYLYDYFIDSNFWSVGGKQFMTNVMFNNRFLSLLHGLEGFHTLFYGSPKADATFFEQQRAKVMKELERNGTDSKLKQWVNNNLKTPKLQYETLENKLSHLIDEFSHQLHKRVGDITTFKEFLLKAVKYRNRLSHGAIKETHQGDEFHALYYGLQILLVLCILKSLKIETHENTIAWNENLSRKAYEVIHYINQAQNKLTSSDS